MEWFSGLPRWTCSHFQGPLSWSKGNLTLRSYYQFCRASPVAQMIKEVASQCKRLGFNPLSPLPGGENGNLTPAFLPGNGKDRGDRQATAQLTVRYD